MVDQGRSHFEMVAVQKPSSAQKEEAAQMMLAPRDLSLVLEQGWAVAALKGERV